MSAPISIAGFQGEIPRLNRRALPVNAAQVARNVSFKAATLAPLSRSALVHTFPAAVDTIFLDGVTWLGWEGDVSVVRGPVASDRLYYTGDGAPKMRAGGTIYDLALPAPTVAPTITNLSAPGTISESVFFAYTWVTSLGEESPPSPLSAEILHSPGVTQRVSGFGTPPAGRGVSAIRIYRSQTAASGATALLFAAEVPVATVSHDYDSIANPLGEVIPSTDYDPPPAGLTGLVSLPNGMMAGFVGRDLYFSEPYIPHAWPEKYVLTVDFSIVGLVGFGSNLAVLTQGTPYVAQGLSPENMALEKLEAGLPCASRRGIVDLGYAAMYPSREGLVLISGNQTEIVTRGLFTREQWRELSPQGISGARFERKYLFTRNISAYDSYDAGGVDGWPALDIEATFQTSGPVLDGGSSGYAIYDFGAPQSSFGDQRVGIIDLEGQSPTFSDTNFSPPKAMFYDEPSTELYMLASDGVSVMRWEDPSSPAATALWRSKVFFTNTPANYGAIYVTTDRPIATDDVFQVEVLGDGQSKRTITRANSCERLPGDRAHKEWEIEITTTVEVVNVVMGQTPDEVMQAVA